MIAKAKKTVNLQSKTQSFSGWVLLCLLLFLKELGNSIDIYAVILFEAFVA